MGRAGTVVGLVIAGSLACGPGKGSQGKAGETSGGAGTTSGGIVSTAGITGVTAGSTGGANGGVWRGRIYNDPESFALVLDDCASGQIFELVVEFGCDGIDDTGVFVEIAGVLRPDGDDLNEFDSITVTQFISGPCLLGGCGTGEWSSCVQFEDVCPGFHGCDQWLQDCPRGEKCISYSGDGDSAQESLKCVPVMPGAAGLDEPCTVVGSKASGIDDCAKGLMCWYVDAETLMGRCVAQCGGIPESPECPECTSCINSGEGTLSICLGPCDPLAQDCHTSTDECIPNPMDPHSFSCAIDISGQEGQAFDACEISQQCDPGLWCAPPTAAVECDQAAAGCCLPFCDLTNPVCPGAGQKCVPWFGDRPAPPCQGSIGMCTVP